MTALMQRSIEDALRYAEGVKEALEQIYELRERGEAPPPADLKRLDLLIEDCASHPAFADFHDEMVIPRGTLKPGARFRVTVKGRVR